VHKGLQSIYSTFHPLGDFLNPALALLGQGLKKSPIGQKLDFVNHPYFMQRSRLTGKNLSIIS
jgi:hypothetical protein